MKKLDIVEEETMSLDEKRILLKQAKNKTVHLMLHKTLFKSFFSFRYRVSVAPGFNGDVFLTRFFADKYFNNLIEKYNLKVIDR